MKYEPTINSPIFFFFHEQSTSFQYEYSVIKHMDIISNKRHTIWNITRTHYRADNSDSLVNYTYYF